MLKNLLKNSKTFKKKMLHELRPKKYSIIFTCIIKKVSELIFIFTVRSGWKIVA